MMEKKLDTFEELMLDFLAGKLSEDKFLDTRSEYYYAGAG